MSRYCDCGKSNIVTAPCCVWYCSTKRGKVFHLHREQ
nr:MAG TPA: hypothetical protein [Caudoviricetes sp.]